MDTLDSQLFGRLSILLKSLATGFAMNFLANRPIALRIALIALIPLLAASLFAFARISESRAAFSASEEVERSVEAAKGIGDLVHELQKERGMSAGFVASEGAKFGEALAGQRQATDRLLRAVEAGTAGNTDLAAALETFHDLALMRERTDTREASVGEVARFYTSGIGLLIDAMGSKAYGAADPQINRIFSGYTALALAKEKAGQDQAKRSMQGFGGPASRVRSTR